MANSSFEYAPGIPIWHSTDLVECQIGNALVRDEQFPAGRSPAGRGIYAPTLRHRRGRFWLATTDIDIEGAALERRHPYTETVTGSAPVGGQSRTTTRAMSSEAPPATPRSAST